jgi:hypothetical protein
MIVVNNFHITSISPIPLLLPSSFGSSTSVVHVSSVGSSLVLYTCCTRCTNMSHCVLSGDSLLLAASRIFLMSSLRIPEGPGAFPRFMCFTAAAITSSAGCESGIAKGVTMIGIGSPLGCTLQYSCVYSSNTSCSFSQDTSLHHIPSFLNTVALESRFDGLSFQFGSTPLVYLKCLSDRTTQPSRICPVMYWAFQQSRAFIHQPPCGG